MERAHRELVQSTAAGRLSRDASTDRHGAGGEIGAGAVDGGGQAVAAVARVG